MSEEKKYRTAYALIEEDGSEWARYSIFETREEATREGAEDGYLDTTPFVVEVKIEGPAKPEEIWVPVYSDGTYGFAYQSLHSARESRPHAVGYRKFREVVDE